MQAGNFFDDGRRLLPYGGKNTVLLIEAPQGLVPIDDGDVQVIKLPQLVGGFYRSACHSADQRVPAHEFLQGNRIEDATAL